MITWLPGGQAPECEVEWYVPAKEIEPTTVPARSGES